MYEIQLHISITKRDRYYFHHFVGGQNLPQEFGTFVSPSIDDMIF